jgi:hypothetical protein
MTTSNNRDNEIRNVGQKPSFSFDRPGGENVWSYRTLRVEREIAWHYFYATDGSQENELQRLALAMCHFGGDLDYEGVESNFIAKPSLEAAWSEETKYPDPAYEFMYASPEGQCGSTNIVFGILLGSTSLVDRKDIYYAEGELYAADGTLLDPNHTWLEVIGEDVGYEELRKEWRIDFTSHQSAEKNPDPNGFMRIVMQPVRGHKVETHPLINQPPLSEAEYDSYIFPAQNATAIVYNRKKRTPIEEYDIRNFNGRVERMAARLGLTSLGGILWSDAKRQYIFPFKDGSSIWYPDTYDFAKEDTSGLKGESDESIRERVNEFLPNIAENGIITDDEKEQAEVDAEVGLDLAFRANIAHAAMQRGELVVTDDDIRSKHHDAKETFEALQIAASSRIGRGTLGALAYPALPNIEKDGQDSRT